MKKYYTLPLLLLLVPSISACQDTEHSIVAINNVGKNGLVEIGKYDLLRLIESKQQFVFEQYSPTCSHCTTLRPLLEKYAKNNKKTIYTCNMYGLTEEEFNIDFKGPYPDIFTDYYFPRIQFINDGKLTYEVSNAKFDSYYGLSNILEKHFFSSKIYMVQSEEEFTSYVEKNKNYIAYMYDQNDNRSVSLAAQYIITNEVAKAKKPIVLINFINYEGNLNALYTKFNVEYYAFASLVKDGEVTKTIDWSVADGSELSDLVANI